MLRLCEILTNEIKENFQDFVPNEEFIRWNQMTLLCYCDVRVISWSWFSIYLKKIFQFDCFAKTLSTKCFKLETNSHLEINTPLMKSPLVLFASLRLCAGLIHFSMGTASRPAGDVGEAYRFDISTTRCHMWSCWWQR